MRFVLVLLAIVGLLASPAAAAASQATCRDHGGRTMMDAPRAATPMAQADHAKAADPCCNPGKDQRRGKHNAMRCGQACAGVCSVVTALPVGVMAPLAGSDHTVPAPALVASLKPHEPSRLERPPRSII